MQMVQLIPCAFSQSRKRDSLVAKKKDVTFTQFVFYSMDLGETETGLSLPLFLNTVGILCEENQSELTRIIRLNILPFKR